MPKTRKQNFSKKDSELAKRLLREYDEAIVPCGKIDKARQTLHMTKAYAAFIAEADQKDIDREQFRKLLSRIRVAQAAKSGTSSSSAAASTEADNELNADQEQEDAAELEQRRRENAWRKKSLVTGNAPGTAPPAEFDPDDPVSIAGEF